MKYIWHFSKKKYPTQWKSDPIRKNVYTEYGKRIKSFVPLIVRNMDHS